MEKIRFKKLQWEWIHIYIYMYTYESGHLTFLFLLKELRSNNRTLPSRLSQDSNRFELDRTSDSKVACSGCCYEASTAEECSCTWRSQKKKLLGRWKSETAKDSVRSETVSDFLYNQCCGSLVFMSKKNLDCSNMSLYDVYSPTHRLADLQTVPHRSRFLDRDPQI